jgi:ribosomal protein L16 Arg81 hydroxylase
MHNGLDLKGILDPIDEATFFREYWAGKPLVVTTRNRARFDGLFDLNDLEQYLFIARPPAGDVQLVRSGQLPPLSMVSGLIKESSYDIQAVYNSLSAGFTVVLNAVHFRWPAARRLTIALEDLLRARVQTNVYITGHRGQGFAVHQDDHDVFVLQTCGRKRWTIYERPDAASSAAPRVLHQIELQSGDALYLPIGYPHAAETSDDYSIHVSVGLFPMTWHEFARDCLALATMKDPRWREPMPLAVVRGDAPPPAIADVERRIHESFAALTDLAPVVSSHARTLSATSHRRNPPPSGYAESIRAAESLAPASEVERRPGVGCYVTMSGDTAAIHFMGETMRAPAKAEKALRLIAGRLRFRVNEIDDVLLDESKVVLVRRLIRDGLLQRAGGD